MTAGNLAFGEPGGKTVRVFSRKSATKARQNWKTVHNLEKTAYGGKRKGRVKKRRKTLEKEPVIMYNRICMLYRRNGVFFTSLSTVHEKPNVLPSSFPGKSPQTT